MTIASDLQNAVRLEPRYSGTLDESTLVPSQELIDMWNRDKVSDSVVLFLRALAANHMLQRQEPYNWTFPAIFEDVK